MIKTIASCVLLAVCFSLHAAECNEFDKLSLLQKSTLHIAYKYGEPDSYGYTLAAIAWKESSAGKFRLNIESNDVGLFQINARTAVNTMKVTNHYKKIELLQDLVYNDRLASYIAISVLEYFRKDRTLTNQVYKEMLMSYNTGSQWQSDDKMRQRATEYANDVRRRVSLLKQCKVHWY